MKHKPCIADGCDEHGNRRGMCQNHYKQMRRLVGDSFVPTGVVAELVNDTPCRPRMETCRGRIVARGMCDGHYRKLRRLPTYTPYESRPSLGELLIAAACDECILWRGPLGRDGYGSHRKIWKTQHGPIPEGMQLDHLCRVRACVNTAHLQVVTPQENYRRRSLAGRIIREQGPKDGAFWLALFRDTGKDLFL